MPVLPRPRGEPSQVQSQSARIAVSGTLAVQLLPRRLQGREHIATAVNNRLSAGCAQSLAEFIRRSHSVDMTRSRSAQTARDNRAFARESAIRSAQAGKFDAGRLERKQYCLVIFVFGIAGSA